MHLVGLVYVIWHFTVILSGACVLNTHETKYDEHEPEVHWLLLGRHRPAKLGVNQYLNFNTCKVRKQECNMSGQVPGNQGEDWWLNGDHITTVLSRGHRLYFSFCVYTDQNPKPLWTLTVGVDLRGCSCLQQSQTHSINIIIAIDFIWVLWPLEQSNEQKCFEEWWVWSVDPRTSPDLNPIEHLWDVLDKQVLSKEDSPHKLQDFKSLLPNKLLPDATVDLRVLVKPADQVC